MSSNTGRLNRKLDEKTPHALSPRIIVNLVAFFLLSAALVLYGLVALFGNPTRHRDVVYVDLPDAGGLHNGFPASLNGVPIGSVSGLELNAGGVRVKVTLEPGRELPSNVAPKVLRASPVGEQRIDFRSTSAGAGRPLPDGAVITGTAASTPPDIAKILDKVLTLLKDLPVDRLNGLLHTTAVGFAGRADDFRSTIDSASTLMQMILDHQDTFRTLLTTSPPLLDSVTASMPEIHSLLANLETLTSALSERRYDLVNLLASGTSTAKQVQGLLLANRANLTCLLSDAGDATGFLQGKVLDDLVFDFENAHNFFDLVEKVRARGYAEGLGLGAPTRNDQMWLRIRLLLPPALPTASFYDPQPSVPPTKPGAACENVYGNGVPAASQPGFTPQPEGSVLAPTAAEAQAPPAARTAPASAATATPARVGAAPLSTADPGDGPPGLVLALLGAAIVAGLGSWSAWQRTRKR
jgi:virulence factor Mce-like protein